MIDRRKFIKGVAGLFLAPAIVKAENIMRIQPPKPIVCRGLTFPELARASAQERAGHLLVDDEFTVVRGAALILQEVESGEEIMLGTFDIERGGSFTVPKTGTFRPIVKTPVLESGHQIITTLRSDEITIDGFDMSEFYLDE